MHRGIATREGEVDLVHPLKAGFETDPNSATQPALDPSSKLALAACSKLTLTAYIRLGRCVNLGLKDHQNHLLVFKKKSADQSRRWQLIGIKFTTQQH